MRKFFEMKRLRRCLALLLCFCLIGNLALWASEEDGDGESSDESCPINIGDNAGDTCGCDGGDDGKIDLSSQAHEEMRSKNEKDDNNAKDPISMLGGKLNIPVFDMKLPGAGEKTGLAYLYLRRSFSSQTNTIGAFGYNWTSNLDVTLTPRYEKKETIKYIAHWYRIDAITNVEYIFTGVNIKDERGNLLFFRYDAGTRELVPPVCESSTLVKDGNDYIWTKHYGTKYIFKRSGLILEGGDHENKKVGEDSVSLDVGGHRLDSIEDRFGNIIKFVYSDLFFQEHQYSKYKRRKYLPTKMIEERTGRYIEIEWSDYSEILEGTSSTVTTVNGLGLTTTNLSSAKKPQFFVSAIRDSAGRTINYEYKQEDGLIGMTLHRVIDFFNNVYKYEFIRDESNIDGNGKKWIKAFKKWDAFGRAYTYLFSKKPTYYSDSWAGSVEDPGNSKVRVKKMTGPDGVDMNFHYDPFLSTTIYTDKEGNSSAAMYEHGQLLTHIHPSGKIDNYSYDGAFNRTHIQKGNALVQAKYDEKHNKVEEINAEGVVVKYEYDPVFNLWTKVTDENNKLWTREVSNGSPTALADPLGRTTRAKYNEWGEIIEKTNPRGYTTKFERDKYGFISRRIDAKGNIYRFKYDQLGRKLWEIDPLGRKWTYEYNDFGKMIKVIFPNGSTNEFIYEKGLRVSSERDAEGHETAYTYDDFDRLLKIIYPDGSYTKNSYDNMGNLLSYKDESGRVFRYEYDSAGRKITDIDPDGNETIYVYDSSSSCSSCSGEDQPSAIIDALGNETKFEYYENGNLKKQILPDQTYFEYLYDIWGNIESVKQNGISIEEYTYSATGELVCKKDGMGNSISRVFDNNGNITRLTTPAGHSIIYTYDELDQLIQVENVVGDKITLKYDKVGNMISFSDPKGNSTYFEYDKMGRLINLVDSLGNSRKSTYDLMGRVISSIDSNGAEFFYYYDTLGSLIKRGMPTGKDIHYSYENNGRKVKIDDQMGLSTYYYDNAGRLLKLQDPNTKEVLSSYNALGNRSSLTYPSGRKVFYSYDDNSRLTKIENCDPGEAKGNGEIFQISYDVRGRRASLSYPNGAVTTYNYDDVSRLTNIQTKNSSNVDLMNVSYTHDKNGNRLTRTSLEGTQTYVYDSLDQITKVTYEDGSIEEFTYDKVGNRVKHAEITPSPESISTTVSQTFNHLNQLEKTILEGENLPQTGTTVIQGKVADSNIDKVYVNNTEATINGDTYSLGNVTLIPGENIIEVRSVDKAGNETTSEQKLYFDPNSLGSYKYDANGNLVQKSIEGVIWNYGWDSENRLIKVTNSSGVNVEYAYYSNGNRAWRLINGVKTIYAYDDSHVISEYSEQGILLKEYIYTDNIDEILTSIKGSTTSYYHQDGMNSIVCISDRNGSTIANYNYRAFGNIKKKNGSVDNQLTYTGRWLEPETGDFFYRARYYNSIIGMFLKKDPAGLEGGDYNLYRYVGNNPVNFNDPLGLHREGGPWHPPTKVRLRCSYAGDTCASLSNKMRLLKKAIKSHKAWDRKNNSTTHSQDIADMEKAYQNCVEIYECKCLRNKPKVTDFIGVGTLLGGFSFVLWLLSGGPLFNPAFS